MNGKDYDEDDLFAEFEDSDSDNEIDNVKHSDMAMKGWGRKSSAPSIDNNTATDIKPVAKKTEKKESQSLKNSVDSQKIQVVKESKPIKSEVVIKDKSEKDVKSTSVSKPESVVKIEKNLNPESKSDKKIIPEVKNGLKERENDRKVFISIPGRWKKFNLQEFIIKQIGVTPDMIYLKYDDRPNLYKKGFVVFSSKKETELACQKLDKFKVPEFKYLVRFVKDLELCNSKLFNPDHKHSRSNSIKSSSSHREEYRREEKRLDRPYDSSLHRDQHYPDHHYPVHQAEPIYEPLHDQFGNIIDYVPMEEPIYLSHHNEPVHPPHIPYPNEPIHPPHIPHPIEVVHPPHIPHPDEMAYPSTFDSKKNSTLIDKHAQNGKKQNNNIGKGKDSEQQQQSKTPDSKKNLKKNQTSKDKTPKTPDSKKNLKKNKPSEDKTPKTPNSKKRKNKGGDKDLSQPKPMESSKKRKIKGSSSFKVSNYFNEKHIKNFLLENVKGLEKSEIINCNENSPGDYSLKFEGDETAKVIRRQINKIMVNDKRISVVLI